jgi:hypothetical protein
MKGWFKHRAQEPPPEVPAGAVSQFPATEKACCCPARPAVRVVMPVTGTRPRPVDLLLCNHHYRVSQAALHAAGATAYDPDGVILMSGTAGAGVAEPSPESARPTAGSR